MTDPRIPVPPPRNEPPREYRPGSAERALLEARIREMSGETAELPIFIGGKERSGPSSFVQRAPHRHELQLARVQAAGPQEVEQAIDQALAVAQEWSETSWGDRAAIFLRAADLISGPLRSTLNAATILGQSKSVQQSELDAACELADFLRFNVHFAERIYAEQPISTPEAGNQLDYRPLEGFVLAITPFNFTAIGGNLPTAPAMLGNVVVWKPSEKQALSAHHTMEALRAAGLPGGVVNLLHGSGPKIAEVALAHESFAGLHFTGSEASFSNLWKTIAKNLQWYRGFPRIVGETGGKDFVIAHPSAQVAPLVVALGRGAFEYQGQKCSAASRAYIPASLWPEVRDGILAMIEEITMGDVGEDLSTFMGAVIDENAFKRHRGAIEKARADGLEVVAGGRTDSKDGWFVEPTVLRTENPTYDTMTRELFGPILTMYVFPDARWIETLDLLNETSPFGLTGAVFAEDRDAVMEATRRLRHAAGNFYVNDKPTGAVVGQQPFGGARRSGTNDKAGSFLNLVRWLSPRTIKETFVRPTDWRYPHMG
ncbi:MAG: L-glutamate gamma-semialdehyde dehydrogenase [Gemmatimonadetes bacterium]|nr:L-glutamate gamma-semialdehyde dehydrogenase [Gemmatimonadota bacterium]